MRFLLTQTPEASDAVTHSGLFHSDEVMATAILSHCGIRTVSRVSSVPQDLSANTVVYDIGGGRYDHHMVGGNGARENGIPYSSCGLLWRDYGYRTCQDITGMESADDLEAVWNAVDSSLIQPIDAWDNGISEANEVGLSKLISDFNPTWDSGEDIDTAFLRAVAFADTVLTNRIRAVGSAVKANGLVLQCLHKTEGPILVLPRFLPWQKALRSSGADGGEILFVVFPAFRGGYQCQCVPSEENPRTPKHPLPVSWRGQSQETLRMISGVPTAIFCHPGGFLCGAESREDAIRMAEIAMKEE